MKRIYILLIIIFILAAILGIKIYNSKNPSKYLKYSLEDIQKILDKANKIKNYECKEINGKGCYYFSYVSLYKKKDNKILYGLRNGYTINDYDSRKAITYSNSTVSKKIWFETEMLEYEKPTTSNFLTIGYKGEISSSESLRVIDKAKYKGKNCLIITMRNEDSINIWVDIENGLVLKVDDGKEIYEYEYSFNTVTEEDVTPDLTGYEKIEPELPSRK